jgi:putative transposase
MPRLPRIFVPGLSAHVYQRAHNRDRIFDDACDYQHFLWLLRDAAHRCDVDVHGFALMTNHYHLVATPRHEHALPRAMKAIDGGYTRYYNRKHARIGTVWSARYRAKLIEDENYWLTCLRYVEQNPVRAHMVMGPELYQWTSYRVHAMGTFNEWLVPHDVYLRLGPTPADRQRAYRAILVSDTVVDLPRCLTP